MKWRIWKRPPEWKKISLYAVVILVSLFVCEFAFAARKAKGISRNQLADKMNIAPRYIASIENSGQHPSLQIFYELVTLLDVSVDQFFFPDKETDKSTQRRQLETLLDSMDNKDLTVIPATAKAIQEVKNETAGE